jgi:hypothetical protein
LEEGHFKLHIEEEPLKGRDPLRGFEVARRRIIPKLSDPSLFSLDHSLKKILSET